jgi:glycosyltransferase involved in cell wall biosynthesis
VSASLALRIGVDARMLGWPRTGVGNYMHALLEPLCARHPQASFLLYSNTPVRFELPANAQARVSARKRPGPWWLNVQLPPQLRRDRIDVFWGANGLMPCLGASPPAVVTVHDFVYRFAAATMSRTARWNRRLFQSRSVRRARAVVCVSQATADDLRRIERREADAVLPPPVDARYRRLPLAQVRSVRERHGLPERFLLCVGTLEPRKNLHALLLAQVALADAGEAVLPLALAGLRGWHDKALARLIERAIERGLVVRLGYVPADELVALYAACHAFVMPSIYEGFGMPLLEAQLCGAPVVHGHHASMCEAAGGLGVVSATDSASLRQTLLAVARGEAPLACRLPHTIDNDAAGRAERLWALFQRAAVAASA